MQYPYFRLKDSSRKHPPSLKLPPSPEASTFARGFGGQDVTFLGFNDIDKNFD
jgi:hypothetical protein